MNLSLHILENPTQKYILHTPALLFYSFAWSINFEVSDFLQTSFKLGNNFWDNPYLTKAFAYIEYLSSIFIHSFFSVLESIFESCLKIPLGISLKISFVCVLPSLRYLCFWFAFRGTWKSNHLSSFQKTPGLWSPCPILWEVFIMLAYICNKNNLGPIMSRSIKWMTGLCFYPSSDTVIKYAHITYDRRTEKISSEDTLF